MKARTFPFRYYKNMSMLFIRAQFSVPVFASDAPSPMLFFAPSPSFQPVSLPWQNFLAEGEWSGRPFQIAIQLHL